MSNKFSVDIERKEERKYEEYIRDKKEQDIQEIAEEHEGHEHQKLCPHCNEWKAKKYMTEHLKRCSFNPANLPADKIKLSCKYCGSKYFQHGLGNHEAHCKLKFQTPATPKVIGNDSFDRLRQLKERFPKVYGTLTPEQIKKFLDEEL